MFVSWDSIKGLLGDNSNIHDKHNYLPTTFNVRFLMQLACIQSIPWTPMNRQTKELKGYSSFNSLRRNQEFDFSEIDRIFDLFKTVKDGTGDLTRKKLPG
jgi:hypothetical protein